MASELERTLESQAWDFVQIEGIHFYSYIPAIRKAKGKPRIMCDWHNVESELMERFSAHASTPLLKRLYGRRTTSLIRSLETRLLAECDAHTVCSERERRLLLERDPAAKIAAIPNGVDTAFFSRRNTAEAGRDIVFVGSMDYHANIDAALYFAREIWPALRGDMPERRFVIVGARPTAEVLALASDPGVEVTGTVPDIRPYYESAAAVVVPVRVGSGTRLKVLEAMAAGAPIVSTTLGAEGIEYTDGRDLLIADSAPDFTRRLRELLGNGELLRSIAGGGRELVERKYDWNIIGSKLFDFYAESAGNH